MNECYYDKQIDFFYNRSNNDIVDEWTGTKLVIVLGVGTFFCLFIFFSNSLVIAAVIKNRKFHFPFYYLLANLAAADFFAGIAYVYLMFNTGPATKTLTINRWFLRQGLLDTSLTASLTNLLVIAVERHMSVTSMRIHSNLTKKRVTLLILFVWVIAIFMGAVPTLGWNCLCDISSCSSLAPVYSRSYLIFWTVSNLVTFFIMVVVYLRIYMYVKRKTSVLSPHMSGSISRRRTPMKLMKTVMAVLGAFIVCWTPGLVVLLLDGLNCTQCNVQHVKRWFLLLALLNSAMNPIIYSYKDEDMYSTMKRMIFCFLQERNPEGQPSRIPSMVLSQSDTGSRYMEDNGNRGPACNKSSS
ncbi:lysophosphatidic acid receptor 3 isoform X1 [Sus scrofa]|uniref:Lysophosphatidic acid receptor 1 n=2 Tax=Sus scrofa TaxID=9823 RepID=A0A8D0JST7_PIG|nr:lysophosphatidic acid receptor 3 [Sus scrofa]XP_005656174.1 lysophosphatidic acid receptor 3 isoform X1 [Sus scrofa]ABU41237.1 lysophosphatidic acid protein 3 [Sus scrofa]QCE32099.1 lysophosphatidic acid receptor 3 [Sus scrofa]